MAPLSIGRNRSKRFRQTSLRRPPTKRVGFAGCVCACPGGSGRSCTSDFTPVIDHTVVGAPLAVRLPASGAVNFHGVTGGVYKTRERIHRSNADLRLLAIPTSWSRVADSNPDYDRFSGIGSRSRVGFPLYLPL